MNARREGAQVWQIEALKAEFLFIKILKIWKTYLTIYNYM